MEYFRQGNSQFVDEDYEDAVESYTSAIKGMPNAASPFLNRGTCYLKLKKFYEALEDFNSAIGLNGELELAHFRKGVVYFELEEYESAKKTFEAGLVLRKKNFPKRDQSQYTRYIRKCDAELSEESEIKVDAKPAAVAPKPAPVVAAAAPPAAPVVNPKVAAAQPQSLVLPVRYQYYQSDVTLNISVLAKNLAPEDVVVDFQPDHLRVVLKYRTVGGDQKEEIVIDKDLFDTIDVEKSKYSVLKPKVEIQLVKVSKEVWPSLESTGGPKLPKPAAAAPAAAPSEAMDVEGSSSSATPADAPAKRPKAYASNKDWDRLGSEISKELDAEKPEGDAALQDLFSKIYKDADEDTKMAMKKSFQTSGGTVLSTNWKEVKDKDYEKERQAPKGMEWRNWEGNRLEQVDD